MVETNKLIRDRGTKYHYVPKNKTVRVYADDARPGPSNILADIAWRRNHVQPFPTKVIAEFVAPILKGEGIEIQSIRYDKYCGCSMCPCSPGYVVTVKQPYDGHRFDIWLEFDKQEETAIL